MKFDNYMDPRKTFGKAVTQEAEKNEDIVVLSADSGKSSGFGEFIEKYPEAKVVANAKAFQMMSCCPLDVDFH